MNLFSDSSHLASRAGAATSPWVSRLARLGYAAKGIVYGLVGVLAWMTWRGAANQTDTQGAVQLLASLPMGEVLLALVALGLVGYSLWRFVQAARDTEHKGDDASGWLQRIGYVVSGLIYLGLAVSAARLVFDIAGGGGGSADSWAARALQQPGGRYLLGAGGLVLVGVGLYGFYRAAKASFMRSYDTTEMSETQRRAARVVGRLGLSARGLTFVITGVYAVRAALQQNPEQARGLDGAFQALAGTWLLPVVAVGFVAYGIYCLSRARYRYVHP